MLRHVERIPVHGYDADAFGELALPALAAYLQEVAGHHATALGCGLEALRPRGLSWVLARQRIEAPRAIALGDALEITTWPSGVHPLLVTREFTVSGRGGEELARASTAWLVLDLETRRPVRPGEVLDPVLRPHHEPVAAIPARLPAPAAGAPARRFEVRYADIDVNRHVTNTSYVGWALEGVPEAAWRAERACAVEVHYLAEARLGDAVQVRTDGGPGERAHAVVREADGKELARARTRWVLRR